MSLPSHPADAAEQPSPWLRLHPLSPVIRAGRGLIGLLVLFLAPAFSDTYCSFYGPPEEGIGISQRASPWPFGTRCTYDLADGTTLVIGPRRASALLSPVLVALYLATVGLGLVIPPTRLWRRATWVMLSPALPLGLAVLVTVAPEPLDVILGTTALGLGLGLVPAVLTAGAVYLKYPEERWWVFPSAWLGWALVAPTALILALWLSE